MRIDLVDAQRHVLARRQPRHQRRRLEHHGTIGAGAIDLARVEHDAPAGDLGEARRHREHGRLAAAGVADQGDEFALLHQELELLHDGQRAPGRRIDLLHVEEFDIALEDRRAPGVAHGFGQRLELRHRLDVRQMPVFTHRLVRLAEIHQVFGDLGAQALEGRIVVERHALARPRDRHLERRAERCLGAGLQRDDAVGQQDGLVDVVGDQDDRLAFLGADPLELVLQLGARQGIERGQRLIEQKDVGARRQRPRHGDALAHAARQLRRPAVGGVAQPHHVDVALHPCGALGARCGLEHRIHGERNVGRHREPRHQRIGLEDDAAVGTGALHLPATDRDLAGIGWEQSGHQRDQRRLAGAREAHDGDELTLFDGQIDIVQHGRFTVGLADALEIEERHGQRFIP